MERKYQLLIVDDDPDFLTHYGEYFAQRGFPVDVAQDGLDGLEKLRHGEFDVALVDLKLPNMDGLEMIRQAHQAGIDADMIILSSEGESNKEDAIAVIKVWVSDWFEKTHLDMSKFFQRVKELAEGVPLEEIARFLSVVPKQELKW
jgi:DNA-binding response OmpR family regulator